MSFSAAVDFYIQYKHNTNVVVVVDIAAVADSGFGGVLITIITEQESESLWKDDGQQQNVVNN